MGLLKKITGSYPAQRNRTNQQHQHQGQTAALPTNHGVHNPSPIPSSVYQSNGIAVAPSRPAISTAIATAAPTTAVANTTPVTATAYVPVQSQGVAAPAVAISYVSGSYGDSGNSHNNSSGNNAPVMATVYNPNATTTSNYATASAPVMDSFPPPVAPPPSSQLTSSHYSSNSFTNGNQNYNMDESKFWECPRCTFPNLRTESSCKGCGGSIPPGMLRPSVVGGNAASNAAAVAAASSAGQSHHHYQSSVNHVNDQMAGMNFETSGSVGGHHKYNSSSNTNSTQQKSGIMRVPIPPGMQPGQKIKVRSPDGREVIKPIPPRSEWVYDSGGGSNPFFRIQFGPSVSSTPPAQAHSHHHSNLHEAQAPIGPYTIQWRTFYPHAPSTFEAPPLGMRSVPHIPRGAGTGIPPNGRHKALLIGINYTGTRAALKGCVNDAKNMQNLLMRNGFPNDGSHMLLLTDERSRGREYQPVASNIIKAFHWFMKDVRKGDVLFFHFSGHGGQVPDTTGHEADGYNETLVPLDHSRAGQISDDVLWGSLVYALPEGARLTALMDMCHSGTGLDLPYDYNVDTRRWTEDVNPAHSAGDVVLFSGCEDAQTSADVQSGYQAGGAMTQAFMEAYNRISMSTYHEFLTMVKKALRKKRFSQRPQLTSSQQFDASARIFSLGHQNSGGGVPSVIELNHNPQVGRQKRRHVRPGRLGGGGGDMFGGGNLMNLAAAGIGAAFLADALFG